MIDILIYLLKVSLAITLVSLPYYLWLRKDAVLNIKRIYLTGGIVLSWLAPLLSIRKPQVIGTFTDVYLIDPSVVVSQTATTLPETDGGFTISLFSIALIIYITGLLILSLRYFFMFRKLKGIDRHIDRNDKSIVYTNSNQIFTLFSKIFIPENLKSTSDFNSILIHEKAHLQQLHMIDLIIAETSLLATWFNPFSWLISKMIKENHEHLADRSVLLQGVNPAHYKAQLLNHTVGVELFRLGNQFNHSLTKKRFQMMKKINTPKKGFIKYLVLIPAIVIALGLFTAANAQQKTINGRIVFSEDGKPVPGASIVITGTTRGTVSDIEGRFQIKVDGDPELAISYVGYATIRISANKVSKQDIVFHRQAFKINLDDVQAADPKTNDEKPVYVVDGIVVQEIESLSSDNIEMVQVFKDPDSQEVKKYNAKNGLIMITMKEKPGDLKEVQEKEKKLFFIVEDMPYFPGGREMLKGYIYKNLKYPEKAKKKGLSGDVHVQLTVTTSGAIKDITVVKSSNKIFDEAAKDVFRDMPAWIPGKQRGKPVAVQVIVPVSFNAEQD